MIIAVRQTNPLAVALTAAADRKSVFILSDVSTFGLNDHFHDDSFHPNTRSRCLTALHVDKYCC